jgi:integrase
VDGIDGQSESEKKRLLELACGMDRIMLLLLFETGLLVEELINLRVSDVDMASGSLRIAPDRKIVLSAQTLSEIRDYLKARPGQVYLLEGRCGKPVTCKWRRCVLEKILQRMRIGDFRKRTLGSTNANKYGD